APAEAASAMPKAAAIATQFVPAGAAAAPPCANTAGLTSMAAPNANIEYSTFFIDSSYEIAARRWFPSSSCSRAHTGAAVQHNVKKLVLLRRRKPDVNRRQQGK